MTTMTGASTWRIRDGLPGDANTLGQVEKAAAARFLAIGWRQIAEDDPTPARHFAARVRAGHLLVAEVDDTAIGFVFWRPLSTAVYLEEIDVRPEWGGHGIGAALIEALAARARANGFGEIVLSTFSDVAWNAPWYARHGFRTIADAEIGPELAAIRAGHIARGLDESRRVFMTRACGD